jgi:hypothetical protein
MRTRLIVYPLLLAVFVGAIYVWAVRPVNEEMSGYRAEADEMGRKAYEISRTARIFVDGPRGMPFTGSIAYTYEDRAIQRSVEGRTPHSYEIEACDSVSVNFQKQGDSGVLEVSITDPPGRRVVSNTSAPYGVASVALTH